MAGLRDLRGDPREILEPEPLRERRDLVGGARAAGVQDEPEVHETARQLQRVEPDQSGDADERQIERLLLFSEFVD